MDQSSDKRGAGGSLTPRKTYAATEGSRGAQFCNRIGCSGRIKFGGSGVSDNSKYSKPSFRSSSGNEVTGKSFRSKSCLESERKLSSQVTSDPSESSLSTESEAPRVVSSLSNLSGCQSREVNMTEAGSSSASTSAGPRKTFGSKSGLHNQSASPASRSSALGPFSWKNGSRYGLRNLRCNSMSDAVPPSCSQPEPESVRKNLMKKRFSEGESSSSNRGRKNTPSPNSDRHTSPTTTWNQRSMSVNARTRFSGRQPAVSFSRNDYETPLSVDGNSSQQFSVSGLRSHRRSSNSSDNSSSRTSFASAESGLTQLMNRDVLHRFNIDGIAEVLLALERIEQDEELTHEQILALETSLFLSGLNLYDQHRDMRLDIDNMSYEELLALEERMGSVSTALSEEALSKCLTRSMYAANPSTVETTGTDDDCDDTRCSICQEEYATGDEIGNLVECRHGYHATCINRWLQQKNWCPICKASAEPSRSSSSP